MKNKKDLLQKLRLECEQCKNCELCFTRNNVVFADGNPQSASIILIGEAPGENEDLQGIPFIGRAGKLLNEFLSQAEISREDDLYIINTVKCRPPKNRVPLDKEKDSCRDFLLSQVEIINPKVILLCGATALKSFIKTKIPISKIRGDIFEIEIKDKKYSAIPIFHPSYLLRNHSVEPNSPRDLMLKDLKKAKEMIN
ncbi:MAG: uracil-DNA glycosylase [Candidatus Gastranaerophilales bacterium]|nr:uracil-DNA glycosylase [Candidatus Gastranaerophilales bacterium]